MDCLLDDEYVDMSGKAEFFKNSLTIYPRTI